MRILALDLGERRIGVALSDALGWLATPLTVLSATASRHQLGEAALSAIADLVQKHRVEQIVVGYPRSLSGDVGPQAQRVDSYVSQLRARLPDVPITLWDERLSTAQAGRLIHEAGGHVRRERIDAAAAAVILQSYLDAQQHAQSSLGQGE